MKISIPPKGYPTYAFFSEEIVMLIWVLLVGGALLFRYMWNKGLIVTK